MINPLIRAVISVADIFDDSKPVSMGEEKYYKNDCLKIIMDIYKVIGSIRKLLMIIQMTKE